MTRKGFTLVETLVVIAVLSILVSAASISLRAGREYSKSAICASNLRQIALASFIYAHDYGTLPYGLNTYNNGVPPEGFVGNASYDRQGWWWFHYLYDSLGQDLSPDGLLWCPSRFVLGSLSDNILCSNYGVNFLLYRIYDPHPREEFHGTPVRPDSPSHPGHTILVTDAGYGWVSPQAFLNRSVARFPNSKRIDSFYIPGLSVNRQYSINPDQIGDAVNGRHPNKTVNIALLDGHVAREPAEPLYANESDKWGVQKGGYCPLNWSP